MKIQFTLILVCGLTFRGLAQDRCTDVLKVLNKVTDACQAYAPQDYCNIFVGQAMSDIFQLNDFKSSSSPTGFYSANTIVANLLSVWSDNWESLGVASDQTVLTNAQNDANSNRCVIAVWRNPDASKPGHICLILPGSLSASSAWSLKVPNSANFAMNAPENWRFC